MISEPQRRAPDAHLLDWINAQALETLYLSAITVAELRAGIALMPAWRSKRSMPLLQPLPSPMASPRVPLFFEAAGLNVINPWDACRTPSIREALIDSWRHPG